MVTVSGAYLRGLLTFPSSTMKKIDKPRPSKAGRHLIGYRSVHVEKNAFTG